MPYRMLIAWVGGPPAQRRRSAGTTTEEANAALYRAMERERYAAIWLVTPVSSQWAAESALERARRHATSAELRTVPAELATDPGRALNGLADLVEQATRAYSLTDFEHDVLLADEPSFVQSAWLVLKASGLLQARLLRADAKPRGGVSELAFDGAGFHAVRALEREVAWLRARIRQKAWELAGASETTQRLTDAVASAAAQRLPVALRAVPGGRVESFARAVHEAGPARLGPCIVVDTRFVASGALEEELFGLERPGAGRGPKRGALELGHGGSLVILGADRLAGPVLARLARYLRSGAFLRVEGRREQRCASRVLFGVGAKRALPRRLHELFEAGSVELVSVPPLAERRSDMVDLVAALGEALKVPGMPARLSPEVVELMQAYPWPGDLDELYAEVRRLSLLQVSRVEAAHLSPRLRRGSASPPTSGRPGKPTRPSEVMPLSQRIEQLERQAVTEALEACRHNLSHAAAALEIDRNTLKRKLRQFGLR